MFFLQDRPGIGEQNTEGYNLLRATLSYAFQMDKRKLELGLSGFNLLNEAYVDHISILRAFNVTSPWDKCDVEYSLYILILVV